MWRQLSRDTHRTALRRPLAPEGGSPASACAAVMDHVALMLDAVEAGVNGDRTRVGLSARENRRSWARGAPRAIRPTRHYVASGRVALRKRATPQEPVTEKSYRLNSVRALPSSRAGMLAHLYIAQASPAGSRADGTAPAKRGTRKMIGGVQKACQFQMPTESTPQDNGVRSVDPRCGDGLRLSERPRHPRVNRAAAVNWSGPPR